MRFNSLRLLLAAALVALTCTTHAMADFLSFGTPLTFTCGSNTVSSGDGLWFGSTLSCTGLSKTTKTTVSFNSSLVTYTCNGFPSIAFVPGGTITYDPKCTAPVTTYSGGTWNTTAPCTTGTTQFISGCACQLPFNAGGTISNVQWYTTSCQASANAAPPPGPESPAANLSGPPATAIASPTPMAPAPAALPKNGTPPATAAATAPAAAAPPPVPPPTTKPRNPLFAGLPGRLIVVQASKPAPTPSRSVQADLTKFR